MTDVNLGEEKYDYISMMGVIEHLYYSPKILLDNIRLHLKNNGTFFLDVPNLYYAWNVKKFLQGKHIQQPIDILYFSGIPFVGHHREYNLADIKWVLQTAGFEINRVEFLNYSSDFSWRQLIDFNLLFYLMSLIHPFREVIFVESKCNGRYEK